MSTIRRWRRENTPIPVLTAYDATTARLLARGGVPVLLVGDSAAQMVFGYHRTIDVPLDALIALTAAVKRGAPNCMIMGDMPFMSYHASKAEAMTNCGRMLREGQADVVKLEVHRDDAPLIEKLTAAGVPIVAHIGWRPQQTQRVGAPQIAGKTSEGIAQLAGDARAMEEAGAAMILIEQSTAEASERVVNAVGIPVIGCGAGPACHGHVVVTHDLLGLTEWHPSFAQPVAQLGEQITGAAAQWVDMVQSQRYLVDDHPYKME